MCYDILITYDTGDSFHQEYDVKGIIEIKTSNLDLAKENLQRIKEHYDFYKCKCIFDKGYSFRWADKKEQERILKVLEDAPKARWYVEKYAEVSINLLLDGNKNFRCGAFWCGYFEKLKSAEIVSDMPSDLKIVF